MNRFVFKNSKIFEENNEKRKKEKESIANFSAVYLEEHPRISGFSIFEICSFFNNKTVRKNTKDIYLEAQLIYN